MLKPSASLLICEEPGEDVFVGVKAPLLIGHVIARARLLIELGQAIGCLLEAVLESDQVKLGRDHRRRLLVVLLLSSLVTFVLMMALIVGHGIQIIGMLLLLLMLRGEVVSIICFHFVMPILRG